jgi:hypothetical protein
MSQSLYPVVGGLLCCAAPILLVGFGWAIGRYGPPVSVRWQWRRPAAFEEQE